MVQNMLGKWCSTESAGEMRNMPLMPNCLLVHVFLHRHFGQRSSIIAFMTADPPLLEPLLLNVGLPTLRTHEDALLVENPSLFFHRSLLIVCGISWKSLAQETVGMQACGILWFCSQWSFSSVRRFLSSSSTSTRRSTLPTSVLGSSLRNSTLLGTLNLASSFRQCSKISAEVAV